MSEIYKDANDHMTFFSNIYMNGLIHFHVFCQFLFREVVNIEITLFLLEKNKSQLYLYRINHFIIILPTSFSSGYSYLRRRRLFFYTFYNTSSDAQSNFFSK